MTSLSRNRDFMLLWSGQTVSELGAQLSLVAYPLLALALTGSPAKAGIVGLARIGPIAVMALPAGALADRVNRKHLMATCDAVRAIALGVLAIAVASGHVAYATILVVAVVDGSGFVVSYVAERGALRQLVPDEQLARAVARNESRTFAAMLAGPPLGGVLYGLGRAVPFLVDALSYAASTVSMLLIRSDFQQARGGPERGPLTEGLRWLWRRPFMRACMLLFAAGNPIYSGLGLLIVVLARRDGASPALIGAMLAVAAAGGLAGTLIAPALQRRWPAHRSLLAETCTTALVLPLLLVVHNALLLGLIVAAAELFTPVTNATVVSQRVALAPDRLQGRVQAGSTLVSFSAGWLGPLAVGVLLEYAGRTTTVLTLAGWALLLAIAVATVPAFRAGPAVK